MAMGVAAKVVVGLMLVSLVPALGSSVCDAHSGASDNPRVDADDGPVFLQTALSKEQATVIRKHVSSDLSSSNMGGGASAEESPYCQSLRERVEAFNESHPDPASFVDVDHQEHCLEALAFLPNTTVVVAKYKENTQWTDALAALGMNVTVRPTGGLDETIAYAKYLVEDYENMPLVSVFLHGNAPQDWHSPRNILDIVARINATKLLQLGGYASLNLGKRGGPSGAIGGQSDLFLKRMDCDWKEDLWVRLLKQRLQLEEEGSFAQWGAYCCAQFAVHRDAVRRFSKEFYVSLLQRVEQPQSCSHQSWQLIARDMEYLWHVIFAGTPVMEPSYGEGDFTDA